jgi:hypothetical protein
MGENVRCYWEHVGERIGNLGEYVGNTLGTTTKIVLYFGNLLEPIV